MYSPTTRLLAALELLQSRRSITGPTLAEKLEVEVRSVRRYITMLRDLGIPVESEPGRYGAYYLRPGFRLPPMMFTDPEMLAIILGLVTVRQLGLSGALGVESVTAKIERVLPEELRERVWAVQSVLSVNVKAYNATTSDEMIARFTTAAHLRQQVWIEYQRASNDSTERVLDVYGLVHHMGYWYAVGYCHLRHDLRIFRLDRVQQCKPLETTFVRPDGFNPLQYLLDSIAYVPNMWHVEALLLTTLEDAQTRVPPDAARLEQVADGVMLRCYVGDLDWMARFLVGLACPLKVLKPTELRDEMRRLANAIIEMSED